MESVLQSRGQLHCCFEANRSWNHVPTDNGRDIQNARPETRLDATQLLASLAGRTVSLTEKEVGRLNIRGDQLGSVCETRHLDLFRSPQKVGSIRRGGKVTGASKIGLPADQRWIVSSCHDLVRYRGAGGTPRCNWRHSVVDLFEPAGSTKWPTRSPARTTFSNSLAFSMRTGTAVR
jgi:hypothetical protein